MKRYFDKRNRRLVYIGKKATPDFWDHHWNVKNFRESVERGKKDILLLKTMEAQQLLNFMIIKTQPLQETLLLAEVL